MRCRPLSASRRLLAVATTVAAALLASACTPALNWREVRVDDGGLTLLFPCRPDRLSRALNVAGIPIQMELLSCAADGLNFALGHAVVPVADAPALLAAMRAAQLRNVDGREVAAAPARLAGTAGASAQRVSVEGQRGDERIAMRLLFAAHGSHLFQGSVVGPAAAFGAHAEAAATEYFDGLRVNAAPR